MALVVAAPNVQVPPNVETSLFSGQISDPAVGRLPFATVPATISAQRNENNRQSSQEQNSAATEQQSVETPVTEQAIFNSGEESIILPYSTPFIAQLFGQLASGASVVNSLSGGGTGEPSGFVDFDRLAQFGNTKYMPSEAFKPRTPLPQTEALQETAQAAVEAVAQSVAQVQDVAPQASVAEAGGGISQPQTAAAADIPRENRVTNLSTSLTDSTGEGVSSRPADTSLDKEIADLAAQNVSLFANAGGADAYRASQNSARNNLQTPRPEISLVF